MEWKAKPPPETFTTLRTDQNADQIQARLDAIEKLVAIANVLLFRKLAYLLHRTGHSGDRMDEHFNHVVSLSDRLGKEGVDIDRQQVRRQNPLEPSHIDVLGFLSGTTYALTSETTSLIRAIRKDASGSLLHNVQLETISGALILMAETIARLEGAVEESHEG